jgi:hypothetical protein
VSAGQLPALIAHRGGVAEVPTDVGPPLGVAAGRMLWPEHTSTLPQGSLMALFQTGSWSPAATTSRSGWTGCAVLASSLQLPFAQLADELLACRAPTGEDDIALVAARVTSDTSDSGARRIVRRLPPSPAAVTLARRFTRQLLEEWGVIGETAAAAELAVSELVTNAARHSEDLLELRLACPADVLRVASPTPVTGCHSSPRRTRSRRPVVACSSSSRCRVAGASSRTASARSSGRVRPVTIRARPAAPCREVVWWRHQPGVPLRGTAHGP